MEKDKKVDIDKKDRKNNGNNKKGQRNNRKKFSEWLDKQKKPHEDYILNQYPSHQTIWNLLYQAQELGFISKDGIECLLCFREITLDTFLLLDSDHDQRLRKLTLKENGEWVEGDIDD